MGSSQSSLALQVKLSGKGLKDLEKDLKQPHLLPAFPKLEMIDLSKNKYVLTHSGALCTLTSPTQDQI